MNTLGRRPCFTGSLTAGADTLVGGAASDVFNALTIDATGAAATTLSPFDSIDGGAGKDTLNIYSDGTNNTAVKAGSFAVKNVETININNSGAGTGFGAVDASKFVGATAINQVNIANAVTGLAAGTVAGFQNIGGSVSVQAADAAATAAVSLTNLVEGETVTVGATGTGVLNSVTVTGTVADTNNDGTVANTTVAVTAGKDVQSVAVNTAVATTLVVNTNGKAVSTVDASASTGSITYDAASAVANINTGAGNDTVTVNTTTSNTVGAVINALVNTGAGDDNIIVDTTGTGTTTIKAGDGNDTITMQRALIATDKIDGGAGVDKLVLTTGGTLLAGDYALIGSTVSNVEKLAFGAAASADASQLAQFNELTFATGTNTVDHAAATQTIVALGDLTATAAGYDSSTTPVTYAGTLNVTAQAAATPAAQAIIVNADTANVKVAAASGTNAAAAASQDTFTGTKFATITGDVKTLNIVTANGVDKADLTSAAAKADTLSVAKVTVDGTHLTALTTLTLSGNGSVSVDNGAGVKLATIDASALGGTLAYGANAGNVTGGLTFIGNTSIAESIKLGAGHDDITVNSTYAKMDTITGFDAVQESATAGNSVVDFLTFGGVTLDGASAAGITKMALNTATDTTLALAFVHAATVSNAATGAAQVVQFQFGGDTYLFKDGSTNAGLLDNNDLAVKLAGQVDLSTAFATHVA